MKDLKEIELPRLLMMMNYACKSDDLERDYSRTLTIQLIRFEISSRIKKMTGYQLCLN